MSELDEFIQQEEKAMEVKRKRATVNGIPISDRYLSIGGEPVWAWKLTVHATEQQLQNLKRFLKMEGIIYE